MSEHTRKHRDFIQNITIALLFVSAVLLFAQTQIYGLVSILVPSSPEVICLWISLLQTRRKLP